MLRMAWFKSYEASHDSFKTVRSLTIHFSAAEPPTPPLLIMFVLLSPAARIANARTAITWFVSE